MKARVFQRGIRALLTTAAFLVTVTFTADGEGRGAAPSIEVLRPHGGELFEARSDTQIHWYHADWPTSTSQVRVELVRSGQPCLIVFEGEVETPGTNARYWWVCEYVGDGADYTIRVTALDADPPVVAESDPFSITGCIPAPTMTLIGPLGGETWLARTAQAITWHSTDPSSSVSAWLYKGGKRRALLGHTALDAGEIRYHVSPYLEAGSDYTVALKWMNPCGAPVVDESDSPFTIEGTETLPALTLTSPNGGEVWSADTTQEITWTSVNTTGDVELWLTDDVATYECLGRIPMHDGRFDWSIPPCYDDGANCRIIVRWVGDAIDVEDGSDGTFEVVGSFEPTLTVLDPAGGEIWPAGSTQTIRWTGTFANGEVELDVRTTADSVPSWVGRADMANGELVWDIPPAFTDRTYIIRAHNPACGVEAFSEAFTVTGSATPSLALTAPVNGELFVAGTQCQITWESQNLTGLLWLNLPNDTWTQHGYVEVPVAAGQYTWLIPPSLTWPPPDALTSSGVRLWTVEEVGLSTVNGPTFTIVPGTPLLGDVDVDSDADLRDLAAFQACFTGDWPVHLPTPVCDSFDVEPDGDLDCGDMLDVLDAVTGPVLE